jgi:zinc protease
MNPMPMSHKPISRLSLSVMRTLCCLLLLLFSLPAAAVEVERVVSKGGIEAWLVRDSRNPLLSIHWAWRGGTALDPKDRQGLTSMTLEMLTEGAEDLPSQAFQQQLEDDSISLGFGASRDRIYGQLVTLTESRDRAVDLARLAMTRPRFDDDALTRNRDQFVAGYRSRLANPNFILTLAGLDFFWGDHAYALAGSGRPDTLARITREDMQKLHRARLARDTLLVTASGDIDGKTLGRLLDRMFGDLPARAEPYTLPRVSPKGAGETLLVPRPIPQSVVSMVAEGLPRSDPDWYAATILNYVVGGGGFSSRLMDEVREKQGLTYGISSSLSSLDQAALIGVRGSMSNANTAKAITLTRQIWDDVGRNGITEAEFADAKTYLTGAWPLGLTSNSEIASLLLETRLEGLGPDFINRRNSLIEAVSMADVKRVAARLLDSSRFGTVIVGQPEGITPTRTINIDG